MTMKIYYVQPIIIFLDQFRFTNEVKPLDSL